MCQSCWLNDHFLNPFAWWCFFDYGSNCSKRQTLEPLFFHGNEQEIVYVTISPELDNMDGCMEEKVAVAHNNSSPVSDNQNDDVKTICTFKLQYHLMLPLG